MNDPLKHEEDGGRLNRWKEKKGDKKRMEKKLREKLGHKRANILGQRNTEKEETMQKDEHEKENREEGILRN